MRSFVVLTLISSVLSLPLSNIAGLPSDVGSPVSGVQGAVKNVVNSLEGTVSNAGLQNLPVANAVDSAGKLTPRQGNNVSLPGLPQVIGSAQANATKIAGTIQSLLASTPAASALAGPMSELNDVLTTATNQLGALNGLGMAGILQAKDGEVEASTQQAAQTVSGLTSTVSGVMQQVTEKLGSSVPELAPVISLLNGSLHGIVSTVTGLLPSVTSQLTPILGPVSGTLNSIGLGAGLGLSKV